MDLWREWEAVLFDHRNPDKDAHARAFYEANRAEMDKGADALWPEREPLYSLMLLRATIGPAAFESEKQNNPIDPSLSEWPAEYFERADFWFDEWPANLAVKAMALDPSKGRGDRHGDYQAHVLFGRDAHGVEYVEADLGHQTTEAMCQTFAQHARRFRPDGAALEVNGFQELLAVPLREAFRSAGVDCHVCTVDNSVPKPVRIRRLTPPLHQRRIRFKARSAGTHLLVQQLRDFPNGDKVDGPDALEMARRLAIELHNGRQGRR
jgi:hypothetical protein